MLKSLSGVRLKISMFPISVYLRRTHKLSCGS